ncbi:MAG: TetR-like C-terminal domain-containing protein [Oscillospiraceae bacterium]
MRNEPPELLLPLRDKFDLVNWIYYTECIAAVRHREFESDGNISQICAYFYENRRFYKNLTIQGQNSFSEYLRAYSLHLCRELREVCL